MFPLPNLWLAIVALGASIVNGAVGYGFSSTVTPIALIWYSNKVLNPALVVVEVGVNLTMLLRERGFVRRTWGKARPVVSTLLPGVVLGSMGLSYLAVSDVKVIVYAVLFPLVALQLLGLSRPLRNERRGGAAVGVGIGFLYALTTISGPPLALFLRNQGLSKDEFRATIAQIRLAESVLTIGTYAAFSQFLGTGLITLPSLQLLPFLVLPVAVGVPLGAFLLSGISPDLFRRVVMVVDGVFISYGLSVVLLSLRWLGMEWSQLVFGALLVTTGALAYLGLRRISENGAVQLGRPGTAVPSGPDPRSRDSSRGCDDPPPAGNAG